MRLLSVDVAKYRQLFIEDASEHLRELSRLVVRAEKTLETGPLLDDVFRHVHSIKGMAATMGYDPIKTLAHRMEDLASAQRAARGALTGPVADLLLRGVDTLTRQVDDIANGSLLREDLELLGDLSAWAGKTRGQERALPRPEVPGALRATTLVHGRLSPSCTAPSARAFLVYKKLSAHVKIVASSPTLEQMRAGEGGFENLRFEIWGALDQKVLDGIVAETVDVLSLSLEEQALPQPSPAATASPATPPSIDEARALVGQKNNATVRIRADVLDELMDSLGSLFIDRERLWMLLGSQVSLDVRTALDQMGRRIRRVHSQVMALRMTPMRTLTERYPRLVRDLCHELGKAGELVVVGADIELDRVILEGLDAPFIHLLRNSVDHGFESEAERRAAKKPHSATIRITAERDRDRVVIMVEDDGRGIDVQRVRELARQRALRSEAELAAMSPGEILRLVCEPGFSTRSDVGEISGRGVGMDVVRERVEALGGHLDLDSTPGVGTCVTLRLPLTLALLPVLVVRSGEVALAVPASRVLAVAEASDDGAGLHADFRGERIECVRLCELLGIAQGGRGGSVLVIESQGRRFGIVVDHIVGSREVVVKPLGEPLSRIDCYAGGAIMPDGAPLLIVDLTKVLRMR